MIALTSGQLAEIDGLISNQNRAGAYLYLADIVANAGGPGALGIYNQLVTQSKITSYSGEVGGAAIIGNYNAKWIAEHDTDPNTNYVEDLDAFSKDILVRLFDGAQTLGGVPNVMQIHALDYSVWRAFGLGALFPGDYQRYQDSLNGWSGLASNDPIVQGFFNSSAPGDARTGIDAAEANVWSLDNQNTLRLGALSIFAASGLGKTPESFRFTPLEIAGLAGGAQIARNGYTLKNESITINDDAGPTIASRLTVTDNRTGIVVNVVDANNDVLKPTISDLVSRYGLIAVMKAFATFTDQFKLPGVYADFLNRMKDYVGADTGVGATRADFWGRQVPVQALPKHTGLSHSSFDASSSYFTQLALEDGGTLLASVTTAEAGQLPRSASRYVYVDGVESSPDFDNATVVGVLTPAPGSAEPVQRTAIVGDHEISFASLGSFL